MPPLASSPPLRALSIRQPYAEMILRGFKRIEYRSRPTKIIGERFWIYAAKGTQAWRHEATKGRPVWSHDLSAPNAPPPTWMPELMELLILGKLPTGVIVGSAVIEKVTSHSATDSDQPLYEWHLGDVQRVSDFRKPTRHPQPVWFRPF